MVYLFHCDKCNKDVELSFSMKDDNGRKNAKCPDCGDQLERVWSSPAISVKKDVVIGTKTKSSFVSDGHRVDFGFADHGKMDGVARDSVAKRMKGVRVDEKSGRMVVDVVSNVKDPLGMLEKTNKETIKKSVGQRFKTRRYYGK